MLRQAKLAHNQFIDVRRRLAGRDIFAAGKEVEKRAQAQPGEMAFDVVVAGV